MGENCENKRKAERNAIQRLLKREIAKKPFHNEDNRS